MMDESTTLAELRRRVAEFNTARDWEQFHTPKNVSAAIAIEAAELMERFLWLTDGQVETALKDRDLHSKANKVKRPIIESNAQQARNDINVILRSYAPFKDLLAKYLK